MKKSELNDALEALKLEITLLEDEDEATRKKLSGLVDSMERLIDNDDAAEHASMKDTVMTFIDDYGVKHPRITAIVNDFMNKLMGMGI
jgi:hypothetical protein